METQYRPSPLKLINDSWAYEEPTGISVYVQMPGSGPLVTKLSRKQILAYIARDRAVRNAKARKRKVAHHA